MEEIKKIQELIDNSSNIVFFGGAGVSTESGLKDFRGKNGLYNNKEISNPEYMLSIDCLLREPEKFFTYYRQNMNYTNVLPNITHKYLKKLEDKRKLKAIITQNIDGLHQKAGSNNVIELHGTTIKNYCQKCHKEYEKDIIFNTNDIPKCQCGGIIRPDVVLYGEMLNDSYERAINCLKTADLLIVAGTSLTVFPACNLVNIYTGKHLVIINETKTPFDSLAEIVINKPLGEVFSKLK